MENYDVAVVGAGVTGAAVTRRLSAYRLSVVLLERECDVSFGVSKANSGIIHAGFHHSPSTLKARLEVRGNLMYDALQSELHFPFRRCGIIVAAFSVEEMKIVERLYAQGIENGAIGIELCSRARMISLEPKLNPDVVGGLHAPSGGIVEPYRFVFSLVESALKNGAALKTEFEVVEAKHEKGAFYRIRSRSGEEVTARWVVNAAGLYADEVSRIFGAEEYRIVPRKGEEFLMERNAMCYTNKVVFPVPSPNSKGMLVIPTVEGTTMVGPTAVEVEDKEDLRTTEENFEKVFYSARRLIPAVSERDIITSFAGLRPTLEGDDFYIDLSKKTPRFVQAAGIQSPGLTAAPAVAEYIKDLLKKGGLELIEKPGYDPEIPEVKRLRELSMFEVDELIGKDPDYGEIVCRCESVSEAEIKAAIRRGHTTLDGIKFYTRAGMGRCQGGFCTYKTLKILARETGKPWSEVTRRGGGSYITRKQIGDFAVHSIGSESESAGKTASKKRRGTAQ